MNEWIKNNLKDNVPAWVIVGLIVILLGPSGMDKLIDRLFPGEKTDVTKRSDYGVSPEFMMFSEDTEMHLKQLVNNQSVIIGMLRKIATEMDMASLNRLEIAARVSKLERSAPLPGTLPRNPAGTLP